MSEPTNTKELNENQLEQVTGGCANDIYDQLCSDFFPRDEENPRKCNNCIHFSRDGILERCSRHDFFF